MELKKWIIKIAVKLVDIAFSFVVLVQYFCFPKLLLHGPEPFIKECPSSK